MSFSQVVGDVTFPVLADHSGDQFKAFKLDSNGNAILATAQGEKAPFILQNKPSASGQHGHFTYMGISKCDVGGTVALFDDVTVQADGEIEPALTGDVVLGVAIAAGVDGDIIAVVLGLSSQIAP